MSCSKEQVIAIAMQSRTWVEKGDSIPVHTEKGLGNVKRTSVIKYNLTYIWLHEHLQSTTQPLISNELCMMNLYSFKVAHFIFKVTDVER